MNLAMQKVSEKGNITRIGQLGPFKRRVMDMGVHIGEETGVKIVALSATT